ncbi:MAG: hypothetical protein K0R54_3950 [Clostridiaceae bacterium]|jgi:hypothetical protein|nr:hypothetical protein [Clostridiaceae bacterium]
MKEQFLSQIIPIISTCAVIVISITIKLIGNAVISFLEAKRNEIIGRAGSDKYSKERAVAGEIWDTVEEYFKMNKVNDEIKNKKINMFNEELKREIPYLTDGEINFLTQVIVEEINKGKDALQLKSKKEMLNGISQISNKK